jgi:hypothetical protein
MRRVAFAALLITIMNFQDRIEDIAGTLVQADGSTPATDLVAFLNQALQDGCQDVARNIVANNPYDKHLFVSRTTVSADTNLDESEEIISVERDSSEVRAIPYSGRFGAVNPDSVEFATINDPVYYVENGMLVIKPDYGTTSYIYSVPSYTVDVTLSVITDFPMKYYDHAIQYAAYKVLCRRETDLQDVMRTYTQTEEDIELAQSASGQIQLIQAQKQIVFELYRNMIGTEK